MAASGRLDVLRAREELRAYTAALYSAAPPGLFVELRVRAGAGMTQRFLPTERPDALERAVVEAGAQTDTYIGVLPRSRVGGTRRDVAGEAHVVWADCDGDGAVGALDAFQSRPSVVVRSGSGDNRHAYWLLATAVPVAQVERANLRLALALGADAGSAEVARILRPPATFNHKQAPPSPVRLVQCTVERRYALADLLDGLPDAPPERRGSRRSRSDELLQIAPEVYVHRLTGQVVGRNRKVRCPFHDDRVPSLHVYREATRGWYCFGCRRGGTVYDLAAPLWRRSTRGAEFTALRRDLQRLLS